MVKGNQRESLLTVYDTIFKFGKTPWKWVDWARVFSQSTSGEAVKRRLQRMDKFCDKWGIEIVKRRIGELRHEEADASKRNGPRIRYFTFRQFTSASRRRVDHLLGPVLQESESPQQDVLPEPLDRATSPYEGVTSRGLRHALVGPEG